jgi:hypothetical protein
MKTILKVLALSLLGAGALRSQEPETLLNGHMTYGGFGGPVVRFTRLADQFGALLGGHGGWIINHRLVIGGGAYGLVGQRVEVPYFTLPARTYLTFGYGGLELQYVIRPAKLVHPSFSVLIGGGTARCRAGGMWVTGNDDVFIAEPGAAITMNLTRGIRLDLGGSYRFASGVDIPWMANEDLSGFSGLIAVGFGHF